jgi:hypothetical protein
MHEQRRDDCTALCLPFIVEATGLIPNKHPQPFRISTHIHRVRPHQTYELVIDTISMRRTAGIQDTFEKESEYRRRIVWAQDVGWRNVLSSSSWNRRCLGDIGKLRCTSPEKAEFLTSSFRHLSFSQPKHSSHLITHTLISEASVYTAGDPLIYNSSPSSCVASLGRLSEKMKGNGLSVLEKEIWG